jgi:thiamine biosynthesis lipoprotein
MEDGSGRSVVEAGRRIQSAVPVSRLIPFLALVASACARRAEHHLEGRTMGTTYHVTVVTRGPGPGEGFQAKIDRRLDEVSRHLSTWIEDSEISRFNRLREAGVEFPISGDLFQVMTAATEIFNLSEGAWDGTVSPLVGLWGFGPDGPALAPPSSERIAAARGDFGFDKIEIRRPASLVKRHPSVTVDLSSIAKGYGVDAVAVPLSGRALATSGDYRSYVLDGGVRRSHVIDPRNGQPVANGVVSTSVLAPTCMRADGLATAIMVMGAEAGLTLVLVERGRGFLEEHRSSGFRTQDAPGA